MEPDDIEFELDENISDSNSNVQQRPDFQRQLVFNRLMNQDATPLNITSGSYKKEGGENEIKPILLIQGDSTTNSYIDTSGLLADNSMAETRHRKKESCDLSESEIQSFDEIRH